VKRSLTPRSSWPLILRPRVRHERRRPPPIMMLAAPSGRRCCRCNPIERDGSRSGQPVMLMNRRARQVQAHRRQPGLPVPSGLGAEADHDDLRLHLPNVVINPNPGRPLSRTENFRPRCRTTE